MSQRKSNLAAELRPEWLRDIDARMGAARASGGQSGGLTPHALADTSIHTGILLPSQAPWALTNSISILAGNGLTGGGVLTNDVELSVGAGTLINVSADAVSLADGTAQYQTLITGASPFTPAWTSLTTLAGAGLNFTSGQFAVGQGAGLTVDATTVALTTPGGLSATTVNSAAGNHTHAIASSSNPGAAVSILATDANGHLSLVRLATTDRVRTPLLDTASGPLTLQPANNVVSLPAAVAIQTNNYASQLTGWRVTYTGEADFRYLFVDEMHAKSFIADLEQALAGGQIITKSVAMVAAAFTVPAAGGSGTLRVRDLPSAPNMAVFESGDVVRLRIFNRANGSLTISDAWGVVTNYADGGGADEGTQTWTFTRSTSPNAGGMAANTVIPPDSIVLDYGVSGNGFYEVNAIDGLRAVNSPYARVATWSGHPATGATLRAQFGNLRGVYGYSDAVFGVAMGDAAGANLTVEATNGVRLRNGATDKIVLSPGGDSYFAGVMTIGVNGEIRQGVGTIGSDFTGLRIWRDGNIGRIAGYNTNTLQWYAGTDGYLYGGAGKAAMMQYGILLQSENFASGGSWPHNVVGVHAVANVSAPTGNYRGSLMFGTPPGVYANSPRVWFLHYPGTLPAVTPVGGGASLPTALMISDDSGNGPWVVWHAGNDGHLSELDADLLDGRHASEFALLTGAVFSGAVTPDAGGVRDLGASGAAWRRIYVDEVIASTITGSTGLVGSIWQNDPGDMYIRSNSASARTLYVANPGAGVMHLDVEGNITLGGTVDGVDISVHAASQDAHHPRVHTLDGSDHTGTLSWSKVSKTGSNLADLATRSHTSLTDIGTNTHAQIDSHIATSDIHVAHSGVSIVAGDGLTGGGTIAATRTLTLGTPGSATATSTNAVTATSHTHAIDSTIARSAITISAGNGLAGGGDLTANRTLTLGTPSDLTANTTNAVTSTSHTHAIATGVASTLTVSSTNTAGSSANLARADHTHAITSSSNPGAAASLLATNSSGYLQLVRLGLGMSPTRPLDVSGDAGVSGQVIAGSGAFSGNVSITNNGNLTVGTVLQVNTAGTRVGINRAADQQFDLDVAGAIRGQYLIGRHAIQLASAVGVWHFDGPQPYNLDYTGSNASHMGVGGTEAGGVIYRPGRYGKAVQMAEATTNYVTNPSFENQATTGWIVYQSPVISYPTNAFYGQYCLSMADNGTRSPYLYQTNAPVTLAQGQAWTFSVYVKASNGQSVGKTCTIALRESGGSTSSTTATLTADWQRIVVTRTLTMNPPTSLDRWIMMNSTMTEDAILIDGIQLEQKAYATPYCDGSLGAGHSWNGTPHASTSSRTATTLTYANNAGLNGDEGTIMMWARHDGLASSGMGLFGSGANAQFDAYVDSFGVVRFRQNNLFISAAGVTSGAWIHYAFTWSKSANVRKIFLNGVEVASRQFDSGATLGSTLSVGSITAGGAFSANGLIDEFVLLDYAADPKLIRAIYESDAPVFVESSVFHWRSPSRVPIWVDEFGLWARGVGGNEILGLYGGDPRNPTGNVTRSWGGITMEENDVVIGRAAQAAVHWDDSAGTMLIGRPSAANMLLSGGALRIRNGTTDKIVLDSGGNASFSGAITAESGNIAGVLSIGSSGGIYQGSGSFASPTTGLKIWNDGGVGRIGGYNGGVLQWGAETNGKLRAGAVLLDSTGIFIESISTADSLRGYKFVFDNMTHAGLFSNVSSGMVNVRLYANANESLQVVHNNKDAMLQIRSLAHPNNPATTTLSAGNSNVTAFIAAIALGTQAQIQSQAPDGYDFTGNFTLTGAFSSTSTVTATGFIGAWELFNEQSSTPSTPSSGTQARLYMKADKLIIQYNDGGTVRYKYLDLTGTGVTWVHTTTAP